MKELLARILENSLNEIYAFDGVSLRFLRVSEGAQQNLGYSAAELAQMTPLDIKPALSKNDFNMLLAPLRLAEEKIIIFETEHARKDGTRYPVEVRLTYASTETPPVFLAIVLDLTERQRKAQGKTAETERYARQNEAFSHLARQEAWDAGQTSNLLDLITKSTATALQVDRVRLWLFREGFSMAVCASLYERATGRHSSGVEITLSEFPRYFNALLEGRALSATPSCDAPWHVEIKGSVLCPQPGTSLLIVPVRSARRLLGVISCEIVGPERRCYPDEERFVASMADFTALVISENELVRAKEAAEQGARAKSTFLSNMSHEFRTPLNAVIGFAQLLNTDPADPLTASQQECVDNILTAGLHLLDLVTDLLDLSFVENGRLQLNLKGIEISRLIQECINLVSAESTLQGIRIACDANGCNENIVWADEVRLRQALLNLLSNSIKYNKNGGEIIITCAPLPNGTIRIIVRDSGNGIPEIILDRLFEPFNHLDTVNDAIPGVGVGLVLTKHLVEMMGGTIGVESEVGYGSAFWIDLRAYSGSSSTQRADATSRRKEVILYVEDMPNNIRLVKSVLKRHRPDAIILTAQTAKSGLELARAYQPDAILLDIGLPDMSGYEVLAALRRLDQTRETPIIGISSDASPDDVEKGLRAGFQNYLTKPFILQEFHNAIDQLLPKSKLN